MTITQGKRQGCETEGVALVNVLATSRQGLILNVEYACLGIDPAAEIVVRPPGVVLK